MYIYIKYGMDMEVKAVSTEYKILLVRRVL